MRVCLADNCLNNYLETIYYITRVALGAVWENIGNRVCEHEHMWSRREKAFPWQPANATSHVDLFDMKRNLLRMNRPEFVLFSRSNLVSFFLREKCVHNINATACHSVEIWTNAMSRWMPSEVYVDANVNTEQYYTRKSMRRNAKC